MRSGRDSAIAGLARGSKRRCRAAGPVCPIGGCRRFQMSNEDLGQEGPVPPVPLKGEFHIGPRRVLMVVGIAAKPDAVAVVCRPVPELEEPDRRVSKSDVRPAGANRIFAAAREMMPA